MAETLQRRALLKGGPPLLRAGWTRHAIGAAVMMVQVACSSSDCQDPTSPGCADEPAVPTEIRLSQTAIEFDALGLTLAVTADVYDQYGESMPGSTIGWSTADASVVTVAAGEIIAVGNGQTDVTAKAGTVEATVSVSVSQVAASIVVEPGDLSLLQHEAAALSTYLEDRNGYGLEDGRTPSWSSADPAIATVEDGIVSGASPGTTTLMVTLDDAVGEASVEVEAPPPYSGGSQVQGVLAIPEVVDPRSVYVFSAQAGAASVEAGGEFSLSLPADQSSMVMAFRADAPLGLALVAPANVGAMAVLQAPVEISPRSTAVALIALSPSLASAPQAIQGEILELVDGLPETSTLEQQVGSTWEQEGRMPGLEDALFMGAYRDALEAVDRALADLATGADAPVEVPIRNGTYESGLLFTFPETYPPKLTVQNRYVRDVDLYISPADHDGEPWPILPAGFPFQTQIESSLGFPDPTSIADWIELLEKGWGFAPSKNITFDFSPSIPRISIYAYGPGAKGFLADYEAIGTAGNHDRWMRPVARTVMYTVVLPLVEIGYGSLSATAKQKGVEWAVTKMGEALTELLDCTRDASTAKLVGCTLDAFFGLSDASRDAALRSLLDAILAGSGVTVTEAVLKKVIPVLTLVSAAAKGIQAGQAGRAMAESELRQELDVSYNDLVGAWALHVESGADQVGQPGQDLPSPVVLRVDDLNGVPVPNAWVEMAITGGGSVFCDCPRPSEQGPLTFATDGAGRATLHWTLGSEEIQELRARLAGHLDPEVSVPATVSECLPSAAVQAAEELDAIMGVTCIDGDLTVQAPISVLQLDLLETIGGSLWISNSPALTSVNLPSLQSVGGTFGFSGNEMLTSVAAPVLSGPIGFLHIGGNPRLAGLVLPSLETITEGVWIADNGASAGGPGEFRIPSATYVDHINFFRNQGFSAFKMPKLESMREGLHVLDNSSLESIEFTSFATAAWISLQDNADLASVRLPALQTVTGGVNISNNARLAAVAGIGGTVQDLGVNNNPRLVTMDFSGLQEVLNGLSIGQNGAEAGGSATTASFPHLASVGGRLAIGGNEILHAVSAPSLVGPIGFLDIGGNPRLANVALPSLQEITDGVWIADNGAAASVSGPVTLPAVTFVDHINFFRNRAFSSFEMSSLHAMDQGLHVLDNAELGSIDFSSFAIAGWISVHGNPDLASLGFPAIATVSGGLNISGNESLTSVVGLGGTVQDLGVHDNPRLTTMEFSGLTGVVSGLSIGQNGAEANGASIASFPDLESVGGTLSIGGNEMLTEISAPRLTGTIGFLNVGGNARLETVDLPLLEAIADGVWIADNGESATSFGTVTLPSVEFVDHINFFRNEAFGSFEMPLLQSMIQGLHVLDNTNLVSIDFSTFATAGWISLQENPHLGGANLPALQSTTQGISVTNNSALSFLALASLHFVGGGLDVSGNSSMTGFAAPSLSSVAGLSFNGNSSFCASRVDALASQLGLAPGTYGNNGNAGCQ